MIFDSMRDGTLRKWMALVLPSESLFYLYLTSAFIIAMGTYLWFSARNKALGQTEFLKGFSAIFSTKMSGCTNLRSKITYSFLPIA